MFTVCSLKTVFKFQNTKAGEPHSVVCVSSFRFLYMHMSISKCYQVSLKFSQFSYLPLNTTECPGLPLSVAECNYLIPVVNKCPVFPIAMHLLDDRVDDKLIFFSHVRQKAARAKRKFYVIRFLSSFQRGNSFVRSIKSSLNQLSLLFSSHCEHR